MAADVRSLVVDGVAYRYVIAAVDGSFIRVTVWPAADRGRTLGRVRVRFDDPWINFGEVVEPRPLTPAVVATIVRALVADGGEPRDFEWRDGLVR